MPVFVTRLAELTYKFLTDTLTSDETAELCALHNDPEIDRLFLDITNPEWIRTEIGKMYEIDDEAVLQKLKIAHPELFGNG